MNNFVRYLIIQIAVGVFLLLFLLTAGRGQMTCDANLDNRVTIDELVAGVRNALRDECAPCFDRCFEDDGTCPCGDAPCVDLIRVNDELRPADFCGFNDAQIVRCRDRLYPAVQ